MCGRRKPRENRLTEVWGWHVECVCVCVERWRYISRLGKYEAATWDCSILTVVRGPSVASCDSLKFAWSGYSATSKVWSMDHRTVLVVYFFLKFLAPLWSQGLQEEAQSIPSPLIVQINQNWLNYLPQEGCKYCNIHVCMSVGLSVHLYISKTTRPNFSKFCIHVTCGHGSVPIWQQCSAVHYVLLVLWMTSCFHIMAQIQIQARWHRGLESAIIDCLVWCVVR